MYPLLRTWYGVPVEDLAPADRAEADAHMKTEVRYGLAAVNWRSLYATAGAAAAAAPPPVYRHECRSCGAPNVERAPVCSYCRSSLAA